MTQEVKAEEKIEEKIKEKRACAFCGKSLDGLRKDAKFCKPAHRLKYHRRQKGIKPQRRQRNIIETDTLEFLIALNRHIQVSGEQALRNLAEVIDAPIRDSAIDKEFNKLKKGDSDR